MAVPQQVISSLQAWHPDVCSMYIETDNDLHEIETSLPCFSPHHNPWSGTCWQPDVMQRTMTPSEYGLVQQFGDLPSLCNWTYTALQSSAWLCEYKTCTSYIPGLSGSDMGGLKDRKESPRCIGRTSSDRLKGPYWCSLTNRRGGSDRLCGKRFKRMEHLKRHMKTAGIHNEPTYSCDIPECKQSFSRRDNLRDHYWTHVYRGGRVGRNKKLSLVELEGILCPHEAGIYVRLIQRLKASGTGEKAPIVTLYV
jgi:hypothetical protein